jgi:catechol 2,3-dioxygenase-like lactoylglutathione lyase family enzyme
VFDHVTIRVSDREASERFYDTVLQTLEIERTSSSEEGVEWEDFALYAAESDKVVTRHLHVGFVAPSRAEVDDFWRAGTEAGFTSDGEPGPRPQYRGDYYGAFLLDPDGNSAEAVHHGVVREPGHIDHVWLRVADVQASKRFYELVASHAGFSLRTDRPDLAQFAGAGGSFSLVSGQPTQNLHMAFPAYENTAVDRFHEELVAAGHRDNGEPGERPIYHAGYYGAFVLDPDGNNVELVNHNRP